MRTFATILLTAAVCTAQSIRTVAVPDINARSVPSDLALAVGARIRTGLDGMDAYSLVGRKVMREKLGADGFAAAARCDRLECLTEMGVTVGAVAAVTVSLRNLGGTYILTLKLYDLKNGRLENLVTKKYEGPSGGLEEAAAAAVITLAGQKDGGTVKVKDESLGPRRTRKRKTVRLLKKYHAVRSAVGYLRSGEGILEVYEDRMEFKARRNDHVIPFTEIASMEYISRYDDKDRLQDQVMSVFYDTGTGKPKKYNFFGISFDQAREISGFADSNLYVKRQVFYGSNK